MIKQGVLNIPDTGTVNVKQARAFLWNAAWLQEYMNKIWQDGAFPAASVRTPRQKTQEAFSTVRLAIIGPGGTGKTAVLKITEALTIFFAGSDTVQKLAPSNAAARLLGGDTINALCKLPFGNKCLSSKKGRLTKTTMAAHRSKWTTTIAAYLDEVSI